MSAAEGPPLSQYLNWRNSLPLTADVLQRMAVF